MDKKNVTMMTLSSAAINNYIVTEDVTSISDNAFDTILEAALFERLVSDTQSEIVDQPGPYVLMSLVPNSIIITTSTGNLVPHESDSIMDQKLDAVINLTRRVFEKSNVQEQTLLTQLIVRTTPKRSYLVIPETVKAHLSKIKMRLLKELGLPIRLGRFARLNANLPTQIDFKNGVLGRKAVIDEIENGKCHVYTFDSAFDAGNLRILTEGDLKAAANNQIAGLLVQTDFIIPITTTDVQASGLVAIELLKAIWLVK